MNEPVRNQPRQPSCVAASPTELKPSNLNADQSLRAVASLGDPVRKRLFQLVRDSAHALSRDDCAATLGLPRSTIRAHLDRLVEEKLLVVQFRKIGERTGPGSGRPTKLYTADQREVSASVPPRHYDLAAGLLASAVQRSIDNGSDIAQSLAQVAFEEGHRRGAAAGNIHRLLAETGYSPEPDGVGGTIMRNCPFDRLAKDHNQVVCSLNGALLGGALAGCADADHDLAPDAEVSHCCARLVPKGKR
ncbi:helix-turn-helix transcriptional regulator [Arthrobacter glacialis]|nr:transcriptional regulator [Arthrobacter glacialis]POH58413.1 transcriptional regulator [Arthrobacter glacialis]